MPTEEVRLFPRHFSSLMRDCSDLRRVPHEILKLQNGKLMFIGKVVDVSRVRDHLNFISTNRRCSDTIVRRKYEPDSLGAS